MTPTPVAPGLGRGLGSLIPRRSVGSPAPTVAPVPTPPPALSQPDSVAPIPTYSPPSIPVPKPVIPPAEEIHELPLNELQANPEQPRHHMIGVEELAASIREHGILQPLVVQPTGQPHQYQIIAGERRFRAAQLVGLTNVPVIIRSANRQQQLELALVENLQRRDLNPVEEAEAYQRLIDEFNLTQDGVAKQVGKSRSHVGNILRLRTLPQPILDSLARGEISEGHAKVLVGLPSIEAQLQLWREIIQKQLPVRSLERIVRQHSTHRRAADHELDDLVATLQGQFGTKVTITRRRNRGKITFEYYAAEDLQRLVNRFLNRQPYA